MVDVFSKIYETRFWQRGESVSGKGSDIDATRALAEALPDVLRRYGIRSILDIPCGDFWMRRVGLSEVDYIGADIVPELIADNIEKHPADFRVLDICTDPLPKVDLVFCRDCLVHLSNADVLKALANIKASGAKWLMATTFPTRSQNVNIETGRWRPLNLCAAPFNLPDPVDTINEQCDSDGGAFTDKSMSLYSL